MPELRVGIDVSPLALTRAGTARYVTSLLAALAAERSLELRRSTRLPRRPPLPIRARSIPFADAARRHGPRPRDAPPSPGLQSLDPRLQRLRAAPRRARG